MRRLLSLLILLSVAGCAYVTPVVSDPPPENIIKHYEWCQKVVYRPTSIARFEGFWKKHHPADEEYEDAIQVRYVRRCAYRLAYLYAWDGQKDKCGGMIRWLEAHDSTLH